MSQGFNNYEKCGCLISSSLFLSKEDFSLLGKKTIQHERKKYFLFMASTFETSFLPQWSQPTVISNLCKNFSPKHALI